MIHQSQLAPEANKFHVGNGDDGKHYWLTPPDLFDKLNARYSFTFDPCPFPKPADFDGLTCDWGASNYVNPPFGSIVHQGKKKGPTAWVRKAIAEQQKGNRVVLVYPIDKWVLMLLAAGAKVENLGDVRWLATEDGSVGKGTGRHIACFVLEPKPSAEAHVTKTGAFMTPVVQQAGEPRLRFESVLSELLARVDDDALVGRVQDAWAALGGFQQAGEPTADDLEWIAGNIVGFGDFAKEAELLRNRAALDRALTSRLQAGEPTDALPEPITKAIAELREAEWRSGMNRADRGKIEYADHWAKVLVDAIRALLASRPQQPQAETPLTTEALNEAWKRGYKVGQETAHPNTGAHPPEAEPVEPLQKLLEYCDASDDSQYGTLSSSLVRELVNEAIAAARVLPPEAQEPKT